MSEEETPTGKPMMKFEMKISTSDGTEDRYDRVVWQVAAEYNRYAWLEPMMDIDSVAAKMGKAFDAAIKEFLS